MIVAIDGPAGSGKTTIAKNLAQKLKFSYLDTGATYRALTYAALERGVDLSKEQDLTSLVGELNLKLKGNKVYLGDFDISKEIRAPRIDKNISKVASFAKVREEMRFLQRNMANSEKCVVEGRDITTVVFPEADFKFYLDADQRVRIQRRIDQLLSQEEPFDSKEVKKDLIKRDQADMSRKVGSLKLAKDARYIDTTDLSIDEVVDKLFDIVRGS